MTRITTFQVAGILVAALMCFPAVCYAYNKTITRPTTTTEAITNGPTTKTASNMTTTGPTTTTTSNMTTAVPTTTAASITTTGTTTTTERNMTTAGPTTTAASTITTGPTTKTASNMTTTGPTATTASTITTAGPTTTAASITTTGTTTTTESNMTTAGPTTTAASTITTAGPTTTAASKTTTNASNMTTTEATTTTEPTSTTVSKMTTTVPTTITESNMTTMVSNLTTESATTSTTPSGGTTSAPKARWEVRDKDGKLCMLMDFSGTITDVNTNATEQIPSYASTSASDCRSCSNSAFVLDFKTVFAEWDIELNFTTRGGSYKLHTLSLRRSTLGTPLSSSVTEDFFDVPLGDYYNCSHFNYSLGYLQLNLTNPLLQPFVQKTKGEDDWGQRYVCQLAHSDSNIGIILGVSIPVFVVLLLCCCMVNCRKRVSRSYECSAACVSTSTSTNY